MAKHLIYPQKLESEQFGGNYVNFTITKSKMGKNLRNAVNAAGDLIKKVSEINSLDELGSSVEDFVKSNATLDNFKNVASKGLEGLKDFVYENSSNINDTPDSAAKSAQQAVRDATAKNIKPVSFGNVKKINGDTITLLLPVGINSNYAANYTQFDLMDAIGLNSVLSNTKKNIASDITRMTLNPMREQLFQSMDNRSFNFNYEFLPRNEKELEEVMDIIYMFKYHMHPELAAKTFMYKFPSEFEIEFGYEDNPNPFLFKISSCALTNVSLNYTPRDTVSMHHNGAPTHINMTLTFKELAVLDKDMIKDGM